MARTERTDQLELDMYIKRDLAVKEFVSAYLANGYNAKQAYRVIKPESTDRTAEVEGSKLLRNPESKLLIDRKLRGIMKKFEVTQDRIIQELSCIAFLDTAELFREDGTLKKISEMPEHARRSLSGVDCRISSKEKALELLGKHHKMFVDKVEVESTVQAAVKSIDIDERIKQLTGGESIDDLLQ